MREKDEKINIKNLNKCIKEYKDLGKNLSILILITILVLIFYLLNKIHFFVFIGELLTVILPLFIGFIIAWLLSPLINKISSKKIPKIVACIIVYTLLLGIVVLALGLVIPNFVVQIKELINATPSILDELKNMVNNIFANTDGIIFDNIKKNIFTTIGNMANDISTNIPQTLIGGTKTLISSITTIILSLMISFYLSYDYQKVTKKIYHFIPQKYHDNTKDLVRRINHSLRGYVQGVLLIMSLVFISQAIGLTLAGLKAPLIFALFCAITDVIPYFGPWIGAIPAIAVGFTISPLTGIFTIISIIIVQSLENNFYQPLIMGHTMKLHPVTIMLGLLIFGHFFGIIGMIVATPAVATLKIILTFIDEKVRLLEKLENITNN